jgi:adenylate kinase
VSNRIYIFIGPPGSGKGSLSALCVQKLGWLQLSTGNMCRREIGRSSEIGQQIAFLIKSGKLIPDGLIAGMVKKDLEESLNSNSNVILDGFPRTVSQAAEFETVLKDMQFVSSNLSIVRLLASDDVVVERLTSRLICSNDTCQAVYSTLDERLKPQQAMVCNTCNAPLRQREDDTRTVVQDRLDQYRFHENQLLDFYKQRDHVWFDVNVEKKLEDVFSEFKHVMALNVR